jgi:hypothetical protein
VTRTPKSTQQRDIAVELESGAYQRQALIRLDPRVDWATNDQTKMRNEGKDTEFSMLFFDRKEPAAAPRARDLASRKRSMPGL